MRAALSSGSSNSSSSSGSSNASVSSLSSEDCDLDEVLLIALFIRHHKRRRGELIVRERLNWNAHVAQLLQEGSFRRVYRMEHNSFLKLVHKLRPALQRNVRMGQLRGGAISVEQQVALSLMWLGCGGSITPIRLLFNISEPAAYAIIHRFIGAVNSNGGVGKVEWPSSQEQLDALEAGFAARSGPRRGAPILRGCIGAVDGLFIKTRAPRKKETRNQLAYWSGHKRAYGLNVQAVCSSSLRFMAVSCKTAGSTNDVVAWRSSSVPRKLLLLPWGFFLVGDAAYINSDQLLTPHPGHWEAGTDQDTFNFCLSQLRIRVEQAFALLVRRWGILWRKLEVKLKHQPLLIMVLFKLHNFCIDEGEAMMRDSECSSSRGQAMDAALRVGDDGRLLDQSWQTERAAGRPEAPVGVRLRAQRTREVGMSGYVRPLRNSTQQH